MLEFEFGLVGQFSWAEGWGRVNKGEESSQKEEGVPEMVTVSSCYL